MPKGTASPQLPISTGRMKPSTRNSQIAAAKAHAVCVPIPSWRARVYIRAHHRRIETVSNPPTISHQPPWLSGGISVRPSCGGGGSSDSQASCRTNSIGFQLTEASMFRPISTNASEPVIREASPSGPR